MKRKTDSGDDIEETAYASLEAMEEDEKRRNPSRDETGSFFICTVLRDNTYMTHQPLFYIQESYVL